MVLERVVKPEFLRLADRFTTQYNVGAPSRSRLAPTVAAPPVTPSAPPAAPTAPPVTTTGPIAPPPIPDVTGVTTAGGPIAPPTGAPYGGPKVEYDYEPGKQYPSDSEGGQPDGSIPLGYQWVQNPVNGMWMLQRTPNVDPGAVIGTPPETPPTGTYVGPPGLIEGIDYIDPGGVTLPPGYMMEPGGKIVPIPPGAGDVVGDDQVPTAPTGNLGQILKATGSPKQYEPTSAELAEIEQQARTLVDQKIAAAPWYNQARMQGNYEGMLNTEKLRLKQLLIEQGWSQVSPPEFREGGEIPGPADEPITITAHGGERVLTRQQNQSLRGLNLDNMVQFARTPAGRTLLGRLGGRGR